MNGPFGVNILAQTVRDRNALMNWLKQATPAAVVCMDDANLTQQIKALLPNCLTIHRAYNPNDNRWWEVVTPQEWLNAHIGFAENGVVLQCLNEPVLTLAVLDWLVELCRICPAHVTLALPNFAVGNPREDDILNGKYDRLLRLVCGTRHVLVLHEYFRDAPVDEAPYLVGRWGFWRDRADDLGLPRPAIVITEHGRDVGGGRNDGWRGTGWSEAAYFQRLKDARKMYDEDIPVCIYCWGTGFNNDWLSFDIQDALTLQQQLIDWNKTHPIQEHPPVPTPTPLGQYVLTTLPATYVNVRTEPSTNGKDVGDLFKGDVVTLFAPTVNDWVYVEKGALKGWVSLQNGKVAFAPAPANEHFRLTSPLPGGVITSRFNEPRDYGRHEGTDWALAPNPCAIGTVNALASADGVVDSVRDYVSAKGLGKLLSGYGLYVRLKHIVGSDVWYTWYGHLSAPLVCVGQSVKQGEPVGVLGSTGNSSGYHVHLTVQHIGKGLMGYVIDDVVDPESVLET